jgi:hypothetical protein
VRNSNVLMSKSLILLRISVCGAQELVGDGAATGTRSIQRGIDAWRCHSLRAHDAYLFHCCWCRWSVPLVALVLDPLRLVSNFVSWLHFAELLPAVLKLAIPALLALQQIWVLWIVYDSKECFGNLRQLLLQFDSSP